MNIVETHAMEAMAVEELAKKMNAQKVENPVSNPTVTETEEVSFDSELMALANNPYTVEGHVQKWRGIAK